MTSLRDAASKGLDAAEALKPGSGQLDLFAGVSTVGAIAGAQVEARVTKSVSAFASAEARWDQFRKPVGQAVGGIRLRW